MINISKALDANYRHTKEVSSALYAIASAHDRLGNPTLADELCAIARAIEAAHREINAAYSNGLNAALEGSKREVASVLKALVEAV